MKEYKVVHVKTPEEAEAQMNLYAKDGWRVADTALWQTAMTYQVLVTFERDQ